MAKLASYNLEKYLRSDEHPPDTVLYEWLAEQENSKEFVEHKSESQRSLSSSSANAAGAAKPQPAKDTPAPPGWKDKCQKLLNGFYATIFSPSAIEKLVNPDNGFLITPFLSSDEPEANQAEFYAGCRDCLKYIGELVRTVQLPKPSRYVPYTESQHGGLQSHMRTNVLWADLISFLHKSTSRSHLDGVITTMRITRFDIVQEDFNFKFREILHDSKARNSGVMGKMILRMKAADSNKLMVLAACQVVGNMFSNHLSGVFGKQSGNLSIHEAWILYVLNLDGAIFFRYGVPDHILDVDTTVKAQTLAYHQPKVQRNNALKEALKDPKKYASSS